MSSEFCKKKIQFELTALVQVSWRNYIKFANKFKGKGRLKLKLKITREDLKFCLNTIQFDLNQVLEFFWTIETETT